MNEYVVKSPVTFLKPPVWHCSTHGDTDLVVSVLIRGEVTTYCVQCLRVTLEQLGLKPLPRAE